MERHELTLFLKDYCAQNGAQVRLEHGELEETQCTDPGGPDRLVRGVRLCLHFEGRAHKLCWWIDIKSLSSYGYDRRVTGDSEVTGLSNCRRALPSTWLGQLLREQVCDPVKTRLIVKKPITEDRWEVIFSQNQT